METEFETDPVPTRTSRTGRATVLLAAVAVGAGALGITSFASAATNTPSATGSPSASAAATPGTDNSPDEVIRGGHGRKGPESHHFGGKGLGIGGALHGEFVVEKSDGVYETHATQLGEVTAVSSTSITVKSEDDYSKTYSVAADTLLNAKRDGIASIVVGDTVHIGATVEGDKATAEHIVDVTALEANGGGRMFHHELERSAKPAPVSPSDSDSATAS